MIFARRCRPSLAVTTVLTALVLGGCSYSPERSLAVADNTTQATGNTKAKSPSHTKTAHKSATRSVAKSSHGNDKAVAQEASGFSRSIVADAAAKFTGTASEPRRRSFVASNSERDCLVRAMYFESQRASREGLLAVGTVVLNRVNSPSYPSTICGVVGQKNQFARGVLSRPLSARDRHHAEAVADEIIAGKRHTGIGDSMFFHVATRRYKYPNMRYLHVAGGNIFYTKVGRNAPRVTQDTLIASIDSQPTATAPEAPVTVAAAPVADQRVAEQQVTETQQTNQPAAPATTVAAQAPAVPMPVPRALALASQDAPATSQPAVSAEAATAPAAKSINLSLPFATAQSTAGGFIPEPPTRLSYRSIER